VSEFVQDKGTHWPQPGLKLLILNSEHQNKTERQIHYAIKKENELGNGADSLTFVFV